MLAYNLTTSSVNALSNICIASEFRIVAMFCNWLILTVSYTVSSYVCEPFTHKILHASFHWIISLPSTHLKQGKVSYYRHVAFYVLQILITLTRAL